MGSREWSLTALQHALTDDLAQCQTQFERINCEAIARMEMKQIMSERIANGRKLTPGEISVAQEHGLLN